MAAHLLWVVFLGAPVYWTLGVGLAARGRPVRYVGAGVGVYLGALVAWQFGPEAMAWALAVGGVAWGVLAVGNWSARAVAMTW